MLHFFDNVYFLPNETYHTWNLKNVFEFIFFISTVFPMSFFIFGIEWNKLLLEQKCLEQFSENPLPKDLNFKIRCI